MFNVNEKIDVYVPDGGSAEEALARTTHLAIAAHQDDLELMAFQGIGECLHSAEQWFGGIVMTDGAGAPRSGEYGHYSDAEMAEIRKQEQRKAADMGRFSLVIQYGASSAEIKSGINAGIVDHLTAWLEVAQPKVVYLHNLADRHATHVFVSMHALEALRRLPQDKRPEQVYGVEGWGSLDWLPERYRVRLDVGKNREIHGDLIRVFDSQISGGKRYDLAAEARQLANATYDQSHAVDAAEYVMLAMDMMPLITDPNLAYADYISAILREFETNLLANL